MVFTMIPAVAFAGVNDAEEDPSSYGYQETDAKSVKVYLTISNDGMPLLGMDKAQTPMAHVEVDVPYFDLKDYGLEDFYRYQTEGGMGSYVNDTLVKRPTLLHLFIYMTERYYLGLDEKNCGQGEAVSKIFDYKDETVVKYMDGTTAYKSDGSKAAFAPGGSPMSFYISEGFWGHDENLNYYRNHKFPMMEDKFGATADYMLLSDGDVIDVSLNTDRVVIFTGTMLCFNKDDFEGNCGETLSVTSLGTARNGFGETPILNYQNALDVTLYDANWQKTDSKVVAGSDGSYTITLPDKAGEYYLVGMASNAKSEDCADAPAISKVVVKDPNAGKPQEPVKTEDELKADFVKVATVNLTVAATDYAKVKLSWNKVDGADRYEVYRATSKNGTYSKITTTAGRSVTNTKNVKTGKTYYYKVRAAVSTANGTVCSKYSSIKSAKPVLAKVTGVKAKAGKKTVTVSWSKTKGASGYMVYRYDSKSKKYKSVKTIKSGKTVKWTNTGRKKGTTYKYKVKAYRLVDGKKVYSPSYSKVVTAKAK